MRRLGLLAFMLAGTLDAQAPVVAPDSFLGVEAVGGSATVEHLGEVADLKPGAHLHERDVIRTGANGRLSLRLGRLGQIEVGPAAELGIEKLPFSDARHERKSIFSLARGYLRVLWSHGSGTSTWPFYVYFGGQRAGLGTGEFFVDQREGGATRACIASGQMAVVPITGDNLDTLQGPSCARLTPGGVPVLAARSESDWPAMRRDFSIDATAGSAALPAPVMLTLAAPTLPVAPQPAAIAPATPVQSPSPAAATSLPDVVEAREASPPTRGPAAITVPAPTASSPVPSGAIATGAGGGRWVITIGSSPDAGGASALAHRLQAAGYQVQVQPAIVRGASWYRVQLHGLPSQETAQAQAAEIGQKLGLKGVWVFRGAEEKPPH